MKIISKWKEFYDYYMGIYGIDKTLVYDRRKYPMFKWEPIGSYPFVRKFVIHFCNMAYTFFDYNGKLYHLPEELEELNDLLIKEGKYREVLYSYSEYSLSKSGDTLYAMYNKPTKANIKHRHPVLRIEHEEKLYIPLLSSFDFHKVVNAEEAYKRVEAFMSWLRDNPPLPDTQSNEGKVISHGHDPKTSFRPKMKNDG